MGPQIRAVLPIESLRVIESLAGDRSDDVFARLRPQTLARIRAAGRLDWLPLDIDLELSGAVVEILGPEHDRERARQCIRRCLDQPLLRPFLHGAEMLFGLAPAGMIATVPRGWNAVYRDAGRMRYEVSDGLRRRLIYEDVPPPMLAARSYLHAIAGALQSLFDLCRVDGTVELGSVEEQRREVELMFEWE